MKNTIEAHLEFSFKGEVYSLNSIIDLDLLMEGGDSLLSVYATLAKEHHIDSYSYQYEVMQEEEIEFMNPHGLATMFFHDGIFDFDGFSAGWQEHKVLALLRPIAMRELGITDLDQHQGLKSALIQAYNLGRST